MSRIFVFDDWASPRNFWKQFLSGVFIVIVMTGLDQDMMQKNLTCRTLREAQKDMCSYGVAFVPVNLLFLSLGVLLTMLPGAEAVNGDDLLPSYVSSFLGDGNSVTLIPIFFTLGVVAASFSTADSALTSMTTSYCIDIRQRPADEKLRKHTHVVMCLLFTLAVLLFRLTTGTSLIDIIYTMVSYTYGPLLGLFAFGLFTQRKPYDGWVPYICVASPLISYGIDMSTKAVWNYHFGYELLIINGLLTFLGLWLSSLHTRSAVRHTPS